MTKISEAVDGFAIPAFAAFWAIALGVLTFVSQEPANAQAMQLRSAPAPTEMVAVELADVIAAQGNDALKQIRAESTRLAVPTLPAR